MLLWRRRLLLVPAALLCCGYGAADTTATGKTADTAAVTPGAASRLTRAVNEQATPAAGRPDVRSSSVLVMDAVDSAILYAKQSERVVPIASITKLMTALVVLQARQPLDEVIEITTADRRLEKSSASRLPVGARLTRGDLLHLALMSSENRAAHAVARSYPGGLAACLRAMNAKARALGMKTARFADPTGLSSRNVSSAADLAKLAVAAADEPTIARYSTHTSHSVAVGRQLLEFRNTNTLVAKPDWDILLQKTGYTSDAGQCLVMKAVIRERPVLIVLLNSFGKYTRVADARRIRKWMEAHPPAQPLAQAGQ